MKTKAIAQLMSNEQYVAKAGRRCPKCRSVKLDADTLEQDGTKAYQNIDCRGCGAFWTDQFELVGFNNFHEKDEVA